MDGQGIDVGDAVLTFFGDISKLDEAFASLPGKASAAGSSMQSSFSGFNDVVDESAGGVEGLGKQAVVAAIVTKTNMGEARGEVRLLGEEFGIRLPRHVGNFVATLPGVGEAMSAAFSATAVLFIAQALVQATEKLSEWVSANLIYTDAMKASNAEIARHNQALELLKATFEKDQEALDNFGKTALQVADEKITKLTKAIYDEVAASKEMAHSADKAQIQYSYWDGIVDQVYMKVGLGPRRFEAAMDAQAQAVINAQDKAQEALKDADNKEKELALAKLQRAKEAREEAQKAYYAEVDIREKALAYAKRADEEELESKRKMYYEQVDLAEKAAKANEATDKAAHDAEVKAYYEKIETQDKDLEIKKQVLKTDEEATQKQIEYAKAHHQTTVELEKELQLLQRLEKEIGVAPHVIDKAKTALDEFAQDGQRAGTQLLNSFGSAMAGMVNHTEHFGKAMEKAVFQTIASMAQKWADFFFAQAIALAFSDPSGAAGDLAGAVGLEALAGALGGLAGGINASGGSSNTGVAQLNGASNTSGAGVRGGTSVRAFADGGLIQAPTRALIGERGTEAVLPLTDPEAMARIGESIGAVVSRAGSGGGGGITVHVHGHVIGANDVAHLTAQISKRVGRGQATLMSSNSLRVTKRSA
jgi:hypothetical protein